DEHGRCQRWQTAIATSRRVHRPCPLPLALAVASFGGPHSGASLLTYISHGVSARGSARGRRRAVADWRQIARSGGVDWLNASGRLQQRDLAGGIAQRVEEFELRPVKFGDRAEVLIEGQLQQLKREDDFLRAVDQDEHVAEARGLVQAVEV